MLASEDEYLSGSSAFVGETLSCFSLVTASPINSLPVLFHCYVSLSFRRYPSGVDHVRHVSKEAHHSCVLDMLVHLRRVLVVRPRVTLRLAVGRPAAGRLRLGRAVTPGGLTLGVLWGIISSSFAPC